MEGLRREVIGHRADLGIALDGDADRCLAVDANGELVDGDQILAILALAMRDSGRLHNDTVVATVMSNLGFVQAMVREQIAVEQTKVGDRYVLEAMKAGGHKLGGEQSGHVILSDHATTGDGTLTAVMLLARVAQTGKSLRRPGRRDDPPAAGPGQRPRRRQVPGRHRPHRPGSRLEPPPPVWAIPAESSSAPPARSLWSE